MNIWEIMSIAVQIGVPTLVRGDPGIGKTEIGREVAKSLSRPNMEVILSICDPTDVGGQPFVKNGDQVDIAPPYWAKWACKNSDGIINFDELGDTPHATQAAALRVILEKQVGPLKLPDGVSIIAASNPSSSSTTGFDLKPAMANRFIHLYFSADFELWKEWILGIKQSFTKIKVMESGKDERNIHKWMLEILSFLEVNRQWHYNLPEEKSKRNGPWPSHRSWAVCARMLAALESAFVSLPADIDEESLSKEKEKRNDCIMEVTAACVGPAAATEFVTWRRKLDLPNPEDILKDKNSWEIPRNRPDIVYTVSNNIVSAIIENNTVERWNAGMDIVVMISQKGYKDVAAGVAKTLGKVKPKGAEFPIQVLEELADVYKFMSEINDERPLFRSM